MTLKEQNKILHDKIKPNVNQYKMDRLNAKISAFSSGDLKKYEFLTRKDLKYKPNALDKTRFGFSPLGKAFSTGLDKTAQGYQEKGVIKLLKDIRGGVKEETMKMIMMMEMIMMIEMIMMMEMMMMMMIQLLKRVLLIYHG